MRSLSVALGAFLLFSATACAYVGSQSGLQDVSDHDASQVVGGATGCLKRIPSVFYTCNADTKFGAACTPVNGMAADDSGAGTVIIRRDKCYECGNACGDPILYGGCYIP